MAARLGSFAPIENRQSRVLVLGSMPGAASLRKHEYYGHRRNSFWPLMCALLGEPVREPYQERLDMLIRHRIALWDVAASCTREGSLDSRIKEVEPNPIGLFLESHTSIRALLFNGQKAYQLFTTYFPDRSDAYFCAVLPSTSPANTMGFEDKLKKWRVLNSFL